MKMYKRKIYYLLLISACIIAVFIRVYQFGNVPGGMNQDGAMAAVDAKALADYGTDRLGMGIWTNECPPELFDDSKY